MKKGKFEVVNLPHGLTHFVDPQFGELDFKKLGEKSLEQLYRKGCRYVRVVAEKKPVQKKAEEKA